MNDTERHEIEETIQSLRKEEQDIIAGVIPTFGEGVVECAVKRERGIWVDIMSILSRHRIKPSVKITLSSENLPTADGVRQELVCGGVLVTITYRVFGTDEHGKDGSPTPEQAERIGEIRRLIAEYSGLV